MIRVCSKDLRVFSESVRWRFIVACAIVCSLLVVGALPTGTSAAVISRLQPFAWGGVSPSTDKVKASTWGSLAMGDVSIANLTSAAPSGGGSATAAITSSGPTGKLRWLRAFAGGTPLFFSEGGTANHVLVAVETATGSHEVWAWGDNSKGQLGTGSTTSFSNPVKIAWTPSTSSETVVHLATGLSHSLMVTVANGQQRLYAWGLNTSGQLGDGTLTQRLTPTVIAVNSNPTFVSIAAGSTHSVAADSTGAVWVWGCDGAQAATSLACGDLGLYGTRYVLSPTKLTDTSVNRITMAVTSKAYVDTTNIATLKLSQPGGFALGDPLAISIGDSVLDTSFQRVASYSRTGTTATVTFDSEHGRQVGDSVYVRGILAIHSSTALVVITAVPTSNSFQFTTAVSGDIATTSTTTGYVFDRIVKTASTNALPSSFTSYATQTRSATTSGTVTFQSPQKAVTHRGLSTTTTAQIWFGESHNYLVGNSIDVSGVDDPASSTVWNGRFVVTAVSNTTGNYWVKYAVATQAATITQEPAPQNASTVISAATSTASSVAYGVSTNLVTVATSSAHGLKTGNAVAIDLGGNRYDKQNVLVASVPTTTSFTYRLHSAIASVATTGTATVIGCFEDCPVAPTGVLEVSAGEGFVLARTSANEVWSWGTTYTNHYGRLGRTPPTSNPTTRFGRVALPSINDAGTTRQCLPSAITAGPANSLVLCNADAGQDTVVAWGHAYFGRTGAGTTTVTSSTLAQATPTEVRACLTCAHNGTTTSLGTVTNSGFDQTGFVTLGRALSAGEDIVKIEQNAAGGFALTENGRIFSWGSNIGRVLGNGRTYEASDQSTKEQYSKAARLATRVQPVNAAGQVIGIQSITTDGNCAHIIDAEDVVWSWGSCGGTGVTAYLSGRGTMGSHSPSSTLTGTKTGLKFDRIDVPSSARIINVETMYRYTFVLLNSGDARNEVSMWAVGSTNTEISSYITDYPGDNSTSSYLLPAKIDLPFGFDTTETSRAVSMLSCGEMHCLMTTNDHRIYGWGDVRTGSSTVSTGAVLPSQRTSGSPAYFGYIADITSELTTAMGVSSFAAPRVAAGTNFSLLVDVGANGTGGTVWGWGYNLYRRASSATATAVIGPTAVTDATNPSSHVAMNDVVSISAGATHSVAIRANGTVVSWGSDAYGQLGDGTVTAQYFSTLPIGSGRVAVRAIASGGYTMVQRDDGSIVGCGLNRRGILGNGNSTNQISPVAMQGGLTFAEFDTAGNLNNQGTSSAVGVTTSGQVYAWGANEYGQIGRGGSLSASTYSSVPVQVLDSLLSPVDSVNSVVAGGTWSGAFGRYEPLTVPGSPTSVSASAANGAVTLNWTAPSPRLELTQYEIEIVGGGETRTVSAGAGVTSTTISGLTNGQSYAFSMRSVNRVGESSATSPVTATPSTLPQPPASIVAEPSQGAIAVTWTPPSSDGGSTILDYQVLVHDAGDDPATDPAVASTTATQLSALFTTSQGLNNGQAYDIRIYSRNSNGSSVTAVTTTGVVPGRPSVPRTVTAVGRAGSAIVTWASPLSDGGAPILSYIVRAYETGTSTLVSTEVVGADVRELSSLSLVNGTTYDITVAASQALGPANQSAAIGAQGSSSTRIQVVAGRPNAPSTAPVVVPANGSLVVTWPAVADVAGIEVTHYKVRAVGPSTVTSSALSESSAQCGTTCTTTLSPLTNGASYTVSVTAGVGTGSTDFGLYGQETVSVPRTVPGSALNLTTDRGDGYLDVSWDPPTSDGGSSITGYELTVTGNGETVVRTVSASTVSTSVTGLTNGVTYSVSVVAQNVAGTSLAPLTGTQKVFTVPSAPVVTTIGPSTSTLSTTRKESDGEIATLTFASATYLNQGDVVDVSGLGTSFDQTDVVILSVTTSTPFTISYASVDTNVVADTAAMGVVRLAGIYLEWNTSGDGGDSITSYNIAVSDGATSAVYQVSSGSVKLSNGTTNATGATSSGCPFAQRYCTISKIEALDDADSTVNVLFSNGDTYVLSIAAVNAAGQGVPTEPSIVVGQPDNPTALVTTAAEQEFTVCWADPARIPAGRSIQSYRVTATYQNVIRTRTLSLAEVAASQSCSSPSVGITIDVFDDGTRPIRGVQYSITIAASVASIELTQNFGAASAASTVTPLGVSDPPTLSSVVVSETSATVTWTAPINTGGQAISSYNVTTDPGGISCVTSSTSCVLSNLRRGQPYVVNITAINPSGASDVAQSSSFSISVVPDASTSVPPVTQVPVVVSPSNSSYWKNVKTKGSIGGSVLVASTASATTSYSVKSRSITVWLRKGPTGGKVSISVNGKVRKTVDLYSAKNGSMVETVTSPTKAPMSLVKFTVSSSKNKKSKGFTVGIDAISPTKTCAKGCLKSLTIPKT